jgi:hypothetical protein
MSEIIIHIQPQKYIDIIRNTPVELLPEISPEIEQQILGKVCKICNKATGTYMYRLLYQVVASHGYWIKPEQFSTQGLVLMTTTNLVKMPNWHERRTFDFN